MIYIGCDVHKKNTKVVWLDVERAEMGKPYNVRTEHLAAHLATFEKPNRIAMEVSATAMFVARELRSCGFDVMVVDAFKASRLLEAFSTGKTDNLDAEGLAALLAAGCLDSAEIWIPDEAIIQLRELTRLHQRLTRQGVALRNQIRKFLGRIGTECSYTDLLGYNAGKFLDELEADIDDDLALVLSQMRSLLGYIDGQLQKVRAALERKAAEHKAIALLRTIPGIGLVLAAIIVAEIGDIKRFANAGRLRSYSRLAPRVQQSGDRCWTGPLVKHGNAYLSWALIQAAQHFAYSSKTKDLPLVRRYRATAFKHGANPAKVSLARKLVNIIYAMLRDGAEFDLSRLASAEGS